MLEVIHINQEIISFYINVHLPYILILAPNKISLFCYIKLALKISISSNKSLGIKRMLEEEFIENIEMLPL